MPQFTGLLNSLNKFKDAIERYTETDNIPDAIEEIGETFADYSKKAADLLRHLDIKGGKVKKTVTEAQAAKLAECQEVLDECKKLCEEKTTGDSQRAAGTASAGTTDSPQGGGQGEGTPGESPPAKVGFNPANVLALIQLAQQILAFIQSLKKDS